MKTSEYVPRFYHEWTKDRVLKTFEVKVRETELWFRAEVNLVNDAVVLVKKYRHEIERYIALRPEFQTSLVPITTRDVPEETAIVQEMIKQSATAGVGPMATVAGAVAEFVGKKLLPQSTELIIENGGDIFIASTKERIAGIYAGENNKFSGKLGIRLPPYPKGIGVCTSSGTVGHSLSFGTADAVVIISESTTLADAVATSAGNHVKNVDDVEKAAEYAVNIPGITGAVIIKDERMAAAGMIELVKT
ncbi:MAG: UPF0280 family protein [Elusimicrobiota bacterium]